MFQLGQYETLAASSDSGEFPLTANGCRPPFASTT
jgi:hypothetical protein